MFRENRLIYFQNPEAAKEAAASSNKPEETNLPDAENMEAKAQTEGVGMVDRAKKFAKEMESFQAISDAIESGNKDILSDYSNLSEGLALRLIERHPEVVLEYLDHFEKSARPAMLVKFLETGGTEAGNCGSRLLYDENYALKQAVLIKIAETSDKSRWRNSFLVHRLLDMVCSDIDIQPIYENFATYCPYLIFYIPSPHIEVRVDLNWKTIFQKVADAGNIEILVDHTSFLMRTLGDAETALLFVDYGKGDLLWKPEWQNLSHELRGRTDLTPDEIAKLAPWL